MECGFNLYDIQRLLSPIKPALFERDYWGKASLLIQRQTHDYYSPLMDEGDLEFLLFTASRATRAIESLEEEGGPRPYSDVRRAWAALDRGVSLRIRSVQRFNKNLRYLCHRLEQYFSFPVNINLYLSRDGSKSLDLHYDTHDVLALQLFGEKRWRLFDKPCPEPLESLPIVMGENFDSIRRTRLKTDWSGKDECQVTRDFRLQAGDLLYVPRGHWHHAECEPGQISCHLTVGVQAYSYLDLIAIHLGYASNFHTKLRKSLPIGFATHAANFSAISQQLATLLEEVGNEAGSDLSMAVSHLARISRHACEVPLQGDILELQRRSNAVVRPGQDQFVIRPGVLCHIHMIDSRSYLAFGQNVFQIPDSHIDAIRRIATGISFQLAELPGELSEEEKTALALQLLEEGLLLTSSTPRQSGVATSFWLPTHINLERRVVDWMDFATKDLSEPFFSQTIHVLSHRVSTLRKRRGTVRELMDIAPELPVLGIITHVSRCGSTLLANCMKALQGVTVFSEPQPVNAFVAALPYDQEEIAAAEIVKMLHGLIGAYSQARRRDDRGIVLKLTSWCTLKVQILQRLFNTVPFIGVIRDPLSIMKSCLRTPPGWFAMQENDSALSTILRWDQCEPASITKERFGAMVLGQYYRSMAEASEFGLKIVDYTALSMENVCRIAGYFGATPSEIELETIARQFKIYSKDSAQKRVFRADFSPEEDAPDLLQWEVAKWAQPAYLKARSLCSYTS